MQFRKKLIPYHQTNYYSKIVIDYLNHAESLSSFYVYKPNKDGLKAALEKRLLFTVNREVLATALDSQYQSLVVSDATKKNIELLKLETTFTITTAHQPNIFTGPLYFIYKILHAIKLAEFCKSIFPQYNFVPVYYMGSEDADLDELGHIYLRGQKLNWNTNQSGAVGRMKVDKGFMDLIENVASQIGVLPHGEEVISLIKSSYAQPTNIQEATLQLVNALFGKYGLVVIIPDNPLLKKQFDQVIKEELLHSLSIKIVQQTNELLEAKGYKPQAVARDINLFYLLDDNRSRIERNGNTWEVADLNKRFTEDEIIHELENHPERFSPNVILRGMLQETILPNIAFIGGGGELAYWLQLKELFDYHHVFCPLLVLRNSFLNIDERQSSLLAKLGLTAEELFSDTFDLQRKWIALHSKNDLNIATHLSHLEEVYKNLQQQVSHVSNSLATHTLALQANAVKKLELLEKKLLRAEKKNYEAAMRQIQAVKKSLFPNDNLQERIDNFMVYYAMYGSEWLDLLLQASLPIEQQFTILELGTT